MANNFNQEYRIIAMYQDMYQERYNRPIQINKYKEKWAVQSLIEDYKIETVIETLKFYFRTNKDNHPLSWFYSNFDTLNNNRIAQANDDILRAERRRLTEQIVMEYKNGVS